MFKKITKKILLILLLLSVFAPMQSTQAQSITIPANFQTLPKAQKIVVLKRLIAQVTVRIQELIAEKNSSQSSLALEEKFFGKENMVKVVTLNNSRLGDVSKIKYLVVRNGTGQKLNRDSLTAKRDIKSYNYNLILTRENENDYIRLANFEARKNIYKQMSKGSVVKFVFYKNDGSIKNASEIKILDVLEQRDTEGVVFNGEYMEYNVDIKTEAHIYYEYYYINKLKYQKDNITYENKVGEGTDLFKPEYISEEIFWKDDKMIYQKRLWKLPNEDVVGLVEYQVFYEDTGNLYLAFKRKLTDRKEYWKYVNNADWDVTEYANNARGNIVDSYIVSQRSGSKFIEKKMSQKPNRTSAYKNFRKSETKDLSIKYPKTWDLYISKNGSYNFTKKDKNGKFIFYLNPNVGIDTGMNGWIKMFYGAPGHELLAKESLVFCSNSDMATDLNMKVLDKWEDKLYTNHRVYRPMKMANYFVSPDLEKDSDFCRKPKSGNRWFAGYLDGGFARGEVTTNKLFFNDKYSENNRGYKNSFLVTLSYKSKSMDGIPKMINNEINPAYERMSEKAIEELPQKGSVELNDFLREAVVVLESIKIK